MRSQITLLLVDDHSIIRAGYQQILQQDPRLHVVAEAETGHGAVDLYREINPDLVLMDLSIPLKPGADEVSSACGMETIRRIISIDPDARILVLTALSGDPYPSQALAMGVSGYLTKHCAPDELLLAVHSVMAGETYLSRAVRSEEGCECECNDPVARLSKRELDVFSMLAGSYSITQIAETMALSPKTIHAHRANILRKLGLKNNAELVRLAMRCGMIQA